MSLVGHLRRPGALRTWWEPRIPLLRPYVDHLAQYANGARELSESGAGYAATVGGIVGRLLETLVEPAPPYAAIMAGGLRSDAAHWPTHMRLTGDQRRAAVEYRPTPAGLQHLVPAVDRGQWSAALRKVAEVEVYSDDLLARARAAAVVTAIESAYRSGGQPVAQPHDQAADDAAAIVSTLSASVFAAVRLCGGSLRGHAAPVLAPHWADGDLLLGPGTSGGYGLIDVKTVRDRTVANPGRSAEWLQQLMSYVACDAAEDLWRIRAVGIWLPRQDALVVWSTRDLWSTLRVDDTALADLVNVLKHCYRADARL